MKSKVWLFLLTGFIAFCSLGQARQTKHRLMGALPNWPHRYAPAVIQGCVHGVSQGQYVLAVMSGSSNIKNDPFPEIKDSCGFFSMKYDLAYPTQVNFSVVDHNFMIPLCPGDTVTIDYDLHQVATSQYDAAENQEKNKALHISGGLSSLLCLDSLLGEVRDETYAFTVDAIEEAHRQSYAEFRQSVWNSHQKRLAHYASLPLSEGEREYMQLVSETAYLDKCASFPFVNTLAPNPLDSVQMAAPDKQVELRDPHASQMLFPHTLHTAYVCSSDKYKPYLIANDLQSSVMGKWLEQLDAANALVARVKAIQPIAAEEINRLPVEYQVPIRELQAQLAPLTVADSLWKPQGEPQTYLQQIVARHPGKRVFVDFWATWCGPCNTGIKEMESVKADLEAQGVVFIYITDNSSSTEGFLEMKRKHHGEHYIFTKEDWGKMQIPGYKNVIPHYLIYGTDGKLKKSITGWTGVENMTKRILEENE